MFLFICKVEKIDIIFTNEKTEGFRPKMTKELCYYTEF
jgi:hypothetical protein